MIRILAALATSTLLVGGGPHASADLAAAAPVPPTSTVRYAPPVPLVIVRRFDPPATKYGAGHLGVDLAAATATVVRAAGAGAVTFAGSVAGRGVVVIQHPDGVRTEYEPVRALVAVGVTVALGQTIGVLSGVHPGCPVAACLHWGARRGFAYLDPLSLLGGLGPVRLLPWPPP